LHIMSKAKTLVTGVSCPYLNVETQQVHGLTLINILRVAGFWALI
jgi:hypothetical protein